MARDKRSAPSWVMAVANGERIIAEELKRLKWKEAQFKGYPKTQAEKAAIASMLRRERTLTIRQIAQRLHRPSWKSLDNRLYLPGKSNAKAAK